MKKSLFLLLFANAYFFCSTASASAQNLFQAIKDTVDFDKTGQYLGYVSADGTFAQGGLELMQPYLDLDDSSLKPSALKDLISGICREREVGNALIKKLKTPNFFNTIVLAITDGTKSQRAGMLVVGFFAAYGVVAACLNVKKKFFDKSNNS